MNGPVSSISSARATIAGCFDAALQRLAVALRLLLLGARVLADEDEPGVFLLALGLRLRRRRRGPIAQRIEEEPEIAGGDALA